MKVNITKYSDDENNPRIEEVIIEPFDTWSMDHTLSLIIVPMLKQLKETQHGAPYVDDEDVPEEIRSTSAPPKENDWDVDGNHFKRWEWVMDEMIWAFTQIKEDEIDPTDMEEYKIRNDRIKRGTTLFGKYYKGLWDQVKYVLIFILLTSDSYKTELVGEYNTMNECFEKREQLVEFMGRPIRNYQAICIIKKK